MAHYQPLRKHKWGFSVDGPPLHVAMGSKCPRDLPEADAPTMLEQGLTDGFTEGVTRTGTPKRVYGYRNGVFFRAEITSPEQDTYHGFPVEHTEVPTRVKRRMRERGVLTTREYKKFRASRH
jgi:hypothetical protein